MTLDIYQIDAFTNHLFKGNPAAVCPLNKWLPDRVLQKIAMENNLSETAFFVRKNGEYHLRWFTPKKEVHLCGHATLATAHLLFSHFNYNEPKLIFHTKSGRLKVRREEDWYYMILSSTSFPKEAPPLDLYHALGGFIADEVYKNIDFMWVLNKEEKVHNIEPNFTALAQIDTRGVIVTAPADAENIDFVSRFFAPSIGVNEDPVTGSAHATLIPYWSQRLNKNELTACQISERGGLLKCKKLNEDSVEISGQASTYLQGKIYIPDHII